MIWLANIWASIIYSACVPLEVDERMHPRPAVEYLVETWFLLGLHET